MLLQPGAHPNHRQDVAMINNPMFENNPSAYRSPWNPDDKPAPSLAWAPSECYSDSAEQDSMELTVQPENKDPANQFMQALLPEQPGLVTRLKWTFWVNMSLVLGHVYVTAWTDPFVSNNNKLQILLALLQIVMLVMSIMGFFVLTSQTLAVRLGRYDAYLKAFRWLYLIWLLELVLIIVTKVYYIVLMQQNYSHLEVWYVTPYYGLWVAQRLILCVFWVAICYASIQALEYKHYDPQHMRSEV